MATLVAPPQSQAMKMSKMIDLALGTPEVGAVNFNMLHTLLHALLSRLNLDDALAEVGEAPQVVPGSAGTEKPSVRFADDQASTVTADSGVEGDKVAPKESTIVPGDVTPRLNVPYHQLVDRVNILESQINVLNSLPAGQDFVSNYFADEEEKLKKTTTDIWQALQMKRRVDSAEEGVGRLTSIVDELMRELRRLNDKNAALERQLKEMSELKGIWEKLTGLETDVASLKELCNRMANQLDQYPHPDTFANFATWEALENALRGVRKDMEDLQKPTERIVVNMATDPMSRPQSSASSRGPSEALQEMLENIGNLADKHELLDERVVVLENEMPNKADKKDLENMKLPTDLLQKINDMKTQLENLMSLRTRDNEAMMRIREALNRLQNEVDKYNEIIQKLMSDNEMSQAKIQELGEKTDDLDCRKADKTYVDELVDQKAEKTALNAKVNFTLFDETTGNLHQMIQDMLKKLMGSEEDLRKLLDSLTDSLEGKLDRDELEPLKEWLDKRLRALAAKIKQGGMPDLSEDDAAGLRKQLLQHFHCISCDRPVDMMPSIPYPSIPERPGLSPTRGMRAYTTFELDAIRQHAKSVAGDVMDAYQTPRACGGSHTVVYPHKRGARIAPGNYVEEEPAAPVKYHKEELDLQGVDGHIYKGRLDYTFGRSLDGGKFPPVEQSLGRTPERPKSGRVTPRATSGRNRPTSARAPPRAESRLDGPSEMLPAPPTPSVDIQQHMSSEDDVQRAPPVAS